MADYHKHRPPFTDRLHSHTRWPADRQQAISLARADADFPAVLHRCGVVLSARERRAIERQYQRALDLLARLGATREEMEG